MRRRFRVVCGCFFLGGRGRGRGVPGRVLLRSFRRTAGSKQPLCMFILYVEQWRFRCSMSSGHRERGFFDPRTPWADAGDVSGFNNSSTCSHLMTVEGLLLLVPPGLHGVVGMMFMHMRSMLLYIICLLHVYVCYMSLALELDMLFVVICCMSVICYMLLFVVICYMSVICSMPVKCLVLGGVVRIRLYVIYCAFV